MKILTCTSISVIAHSLLWLVTPSQSMQFDGGDNAKLIALKVKIQQVATYSLVKKPTESGSEADLNKTIFNGEKNKLALQEQAVIAKVLPAKQSVERVDKIDHQPVHPVVDAVAPTDVSIEPPEQKKIDEDTVTEVEATAIQLAAQHSANNAPINVTQLPLFKMPRPALKYPLRAKRRGQQGVTIVSIELDEYGAIVAVALVKSSGFSVLDKAALNNVKQWQFHAVERYGHAVKAKFTVPVEFSLTS